ncbi:MAG: GMC family oxidoreductase [Acidobacteria bacterium]|nr:GMC family oxidoreductase [Acidobacteriota bacterium]MDA1236853.1 GMC family oxidoreductase [Acidobacteriota bacterium]
MAIKIYDALVVGTGATGGMAAKVLAEQGLQTLLLESGPTISSGDFLTHAMPYEFPFRGSGSPSRIRRVGRAAASEKTPFDGYYSENDQHPYSFPKGNPWGSSRSRILGGRTLHWGRQSLRLAEYDFKGASIDGQGVDWPFEYRDLEPYYDKVEDYIGVQGMTEGMAGIPDGKFLPPFAFNCFEHLMKKSARKLGWQLTALRTAQLSRPHRGRPACHYCGSCGSGCDIGAFFSTVAVTLPDALATGNLTLQTDSVVRQVLVDEEGRPKGVGYHDRLSKDYREVFAKVVVLAASTLESARIMLNSTSRHHPNGLANSSGALGHYLTDHISVGNIVGVLPDLVGGDILNEDGKSNGSYIPRFQNVGSRNPDFIRGYAIMVKGGARIFPGQAREVDGFGPAYKRRIKALHPAMVNVYARAEPLPIYDSYVEIDRDLVDAWGIPALHINYKRTDNDYKIQKHSFQSMLELMHTARVEILSANDTLATPGTVSHELGTARMGHDRKTNVLNAYNQAHDAKNLFVVDGACWPSSACQNPTLTMLAIAWRASDYLVEQYRKNEL